MIAEASPAAEAGRRPIAEARSAAEAARGPAAAARPIVPFSHYTTSMGGRLAIHLDTAYATARLACQAPAATAEVVERIERWASRLTRHDPSSELSALNADARAEVPVGPTLAATLRAGRLASVATQGLADITLLDARLAAEGAAGLEPPEPSAWASRSSGWSLVFGERGAATVRRPPGLRFDLGGVGKGWIADRALGLLDEWPGAVIDADGDLAIRCAPGRTWEVAVDDPRTPDTSLAVLRLGAPGGLPARWGVATSGVSVHRWTVAGLPSHHLIDPRTGRPAVTDVVQATVVAGSALRAEALAKAAVIAGSVAGFALLDAAGLYGAVVLTDRGETLALPQTLSLLAD
jgi:thiamine biosynthesis lipoprotein